MSFSFQLIWAQPAIASCGRIKQEQPQQSKFSMTAKIP